MFDSLPVIIVTAKTSTAAAEIITEIIDNDATAEVRPAGHESPDRVWRLVNKYYSVLVRVHARAEGDAAGAAGAGAGPVDAQLVLLAHDELQPAAAERRLRDAGDGAAAVNVLACDAPAVPDPLLELCARRRLEPVALRDPTPAPAPAAPFPEPRGLQAVRAALHAHAWPGLRRAPPPPPEQRERERESESDEVQNARYALALEALGSAAQLTTGLQGSERREAAEQLVAAFAAAIGHPLEDVDLDLDSTSDSSGDDDLLEP